MNHNLISATRRVAFMIGAAAITLALVLWVLPAQAQIDANPGFNNTLTDGIGADTPAELLPGLRIHTAYRTSGRDPWSAIMAATGNNGGSGMVSGAADGIYNSGSGPANPAANRAIGWRAGNLSTRSGTNFPANFTANPHNAPAPGIDNVATGTPHAPNAATSKALRVYTYYRSVSAVMAIFGMIAIVTGCIASRRQNTAK